MNDRSDIERVLGYWFEDGPETMPDRVVNVVARRISLRSQRRSWRLLRRSPMSTALKYGVAAAAVLVIGIVGYNLLPGSGIGGPRATPTPAPSPSAATFECSLGTAGCAGELPAGDHRSAAFDPYVTFTTQTGLWTNPLDMAEAYELDSPEGAILLWAHPAIVERTAACETTPAAGKGNTPADWIAYITNHPGLVPSNIHSLVIGGALGQGGRTAQSVDLKSATTWTPACADDLWTANLVQFIGTSKPSPIDVYGVGSGGIARFVFVDVSGQTILIAFYANGPLENASTFAQRIIESMRFGCGADAGRPC